MEYSPDLSHRSCVACQGGASALKEKEIEQLLKQLNHGWQVMEGHHLEKEYEFPDFRQGLAFTNEVGEIAEIEGHHPDILLRWGKVKILIWTHKVGGLTESDFILAAKCDEALYKIKSPPMCF